MEPIAIAWILFGAALGYKAAEKRGWSVAVGLLAGAALGLFSPLLFVVSGITSGDVGNRRKCPACAEWIAAEARKCKHCGESVQPVAAAKG